MIQFTKLRLSGFKSFVDAVELGIDPGMTGVVGPNGCGKSNLIEALRWVMGETSARQMRGGEMDDVIFGGTASRPARNLAEVTVVLDNSSRTAPPQFDVDTIEIVRRIERGQGSNYRINGRDVRARDVQLLFADAATGARSSGLVSQGRVGALISAKPSDRRSLLEEAAGISGLYSRRHEAELRLKNAEQNLSRLDDVLVTLDDQARSLQRQARQAARYRSLAEQIRQLDSQLLYVQWLHALATLDAARQARQAAEQSVQQAMVEAARAAQAQAEQAAHVPDLRRLDTERQTIFQRLLLEREQLEAEEGRLAEMRRDLQSRLAQAAGDLQKEQMRADDAAATVTRLAADYQDLQNAAAGESEARQTADTALDLAAQQVADSERRLAEIMEEVAAADAERANALRRLQDSENRRDRLRDRLGQIQAQIAQAEKDAIHQTDLTAAEMDLEAALEFVEESLADAESWDRQKIQAATQRDHARTALQAALTIRDRLQAEADGLQAVLNDARACDFPPILESVTAASGYEPALAAALGEDLSAATDDMAPVHWSSLPPLDPLPLLPVGCDTLSRHIIAPRQLQRRMSQVALAADWSQAWALRENLLPGQCVVTPDGDLVRWDGLVARAGAPNPMAVRLAQQNRLRDVMIQLDDADMGVVTAQEAAGLADLALEDATTHERAARDAVKRAEQETAKARDAHARLAQRHAAHLSRLHTLQDQIATAADDLQDAEEDVLQSRTAVDGFPHLQDQGRERMTVLRLELAERRSWLVECRSNVDRLNRDSADRRRRLDSVLTDMESWRRRAESAQDHVQELADRREAVMIELERLESMPDSLARRRQDVLHRLEQADHDRRHSADQLAAAEAALAESDRRCRSAESAVAQAREQHIRSDAAVGAADQNCRSVASRIAERLDMTPEQLRAVAGDVEETRPDPADLQSRLDRLSRERDAMGPVNLRADQELQDLEQRISQIQTEKSDLEQAIAKLRNAIAELNKEGREKLLASFQQVDQHFRDLFVRLFGGGRAHLALTESDDPLQAGLEIMASPPGKRLQILSLLSGGEQALTALALIFAVFLINPAPICVLDEVDAPLDDANVDRFCSMVENIAHSTKTRFLIVTHHRMSMARMDRLYGVTMAERGISQLVSVDLAQAEAIRDDAKAE